MSIRALDLSGYRGPVRHMSLEAKCEGCFLKKVVCMCALLPRVTTSTRVIVVMHQLEMKKSTNTGRLAVRCLDNSTLVSHDVDLDRVLPARAVVLFPVAGAQPIADFAGTGATLIALDGNWRQAARMRKKFATRGIPFVTAPPGPTTYALRKSAHPLSMSTFEAIARSLAVLDGLDTTSLLRALEIFQDRVLWLRGAKKRDAVAGGIPDGVLRSV